METKNLWTEKMKERLDDYSSETPDEVWKTLETELKPRNNGNGRVLRSLVLLLALLAALSAMAAALL
jgi:hypothetical protein